VTNGGAFANDHSCYHACYHACYHSCYHAW
jgi:hypothetical protein